MCSGGGIPTGASPSPSHASHLPLPPRSSQVRFPSQMEAQAATEIANLQLGLVPSPSPPPSPLPRMPPPPPMPSRLATLLQPCEVVVISDPIVSLELRQFLPPSLPPTSPMPPSPPSPPSAPPAPPTSPGWVTATSVTDLLDAFIAGTTAVELPAGSTITTGGLSMTVPTGQNLTIRGGGTIDGGGAATLFAVGPGSRVTLLGLTLRGGRADSARGRRLQTTSTGQASAMSTTGGGGVVVSGGATAELVGCTIEDCHAVGQGGGGGVLVTGAGSALRLISCRIAACTAVGNGGGVLITFGASVYIEGTEVSGCAAFIGGGIAVEDGASAAILGPSTISDCTADTGAGVVALRDSIWTLSDATVAGCTANGRGLYEGGGGVVVDLGGLGTATRCIIVRCHALNANVGGAVAMRPSLVDGSGATVHLIDTDIRSCTSRTYTGACMAFCDLAGTQLPSFLYVDRGVISNCSSSCGGVTFCVGVGRFNDTVVEDISSVGDGGGFYVLLNGELVLGNVTIRRVAGGKDGGALYCSANMIVDGCTIEQCSAVAQGGGGDFNSGSLTVVNTRFVECTSPLGGGFYTYGTCTTTAGFAACSMYVYGCTFTRCESLTGGGLAAGPGARTVIGAGTRFLRCHATSTGGGVGILGGLVEMADTQVLECSTDANGGGLSLADGSTLQMVRCIISRCATDRNAIVAGPGAADIINGVTCTSSGSSGGGLVVLDLRSKATLVDTEVSECLSTASGGLSINGGEIECLRCSILRNVACVWGGGARASGGNLRFVDCYFGVNFADNTGGGCITLNGVTTVELVNTTLDGCFTGDEAAGTTYGTAPTFLR